EGGLVLDAVTGELITEVRSSDGTFLREGDWSPDGRHLAITSFEGLIEIVEVGTWEPLRSFAHGDAVFVNMVNYSPSGDLLSSIGGDGLVRLWDPDTGTEIRAFGPEPASEFQTAAWSPDGERLVTNTGGAEGSIGTFGYSHVWDPDTGEELVRFEGHEGDLIGVSWSPDGQRIVSIGTDDFARVWDSHSGEEIASIPTHVDFGAPAMWSPDGNLIMIGSDGRPEAKVVEFWQSRDELIAYARECCVFRELTDEEREEFGLDTAVRP
ncbi:MAG: hypothetical protein R3324_19585, partial [Halobacteriales archaeon]|nr:hypothetical protein [Halobacteriales archaeon]